MPDDSTVLMPSSPLNERVVDEEFEREYGQLQFSAFKRALVDQDLLMRDGNARLRNLPEAGGPILYRGWMLDEFAYRALHIALIEHGFTPVTNPQQYLAAHHLPGWLEIFKDVTPRTVFIEPDADFEAIIDAGSALGSESFIVKDYVKSRKHEWESACFARYLDDLPRVVMNFVDLQEEFLVGRVALREYVELDATQPECRVWWAHGKPVLTTLHPDAARDGIDPLEASVPAEFLAQVATLVLELGSPFVTTDVATRVDGSKIVIEVGDGQVSGMPDGVSEDTYQALLDAVI